MAAEIRCNDNLDELRKIQDDSIDLIYIDPPFYTQKNWKKFDDTWESIDHYMEFMRPRINEARRVLKDDGSIYVHVDHHASHHVRSLLDGAFAPENFNNEIIWSYRKWGKRKGFNITHDTIFLYSKDRKKTKFNHLYQPLSKSTLKRFKGKKVSGGNTKTVLDHDSEGSLMGDVWEIPILVAHSKEWQSYPTQKPVKLVERMIKASTDEGDIVLDFFAGSGTTCAAASNLGRKSICIDKNKEACNIMEERLK
jgi:site-specific DNA-methyltransferase (adenine-specific)